MELVDRGRGGEELEEEYGETGLQKIMMKRGDEINETDAVNGWGQHTVLTVRVMKDTGRL